MLAMIHVHLRHVWQVLFITLKPLSHSMQTNSLVQNNLPTFIISSLNSLSQRTGLIFMAGTSDLFEDHKFSGGIRLSTDLRNNEYYLMYENLKTRIDKKYIFHQHRQRFLATPFDRIQYNSTELITSFKYPFNPQSSLQFNCLYRRDVLDTLSTDLYSLQSKTTITNWAGSRVEYIFDNTRMDQVLNILYGTRYKIFIEGYKEFGTPKQYMGLVGLDFRNYTKIHRNFIWANRLAFNASFGPQHILYYLGGVDGWLFSKYDNSLPVPPNQNFAFEALGTNMRGFFQNARNGSNYAVINSELRFPIFSYLSKAPISSDFFRNFQFIAFTDVGTAWSGTSPFNTDNPFNVQTFNRGPITVTLFTNKNPILVGYGTGVRTRLFGYFVRTDIAWGIDDGQISNPIYYLSLSLDF